MKLPLFPLPIFLLPDGITRLRIFEQRYLKMVRIASKENGFVILLNDASKDLPEVRWASWVDIINFDQDDDGTLIIDVKCKSLVTVNAINIDEDNLSYADVSSVSHWPLTNHDDITTALSLSLTKVFEQNKELRDLYQNNVSENANWVIARWLELLPVELRIKDSLTASNSLEQAKELIHSIIIPDQHH
jgi:Lon protease-like protein